MECGKWPVTHLPKDRLEEENMPKTRGGPAAILLACLAAWVALPLLAQTEDPLAVGRKMLAEDNPGELWIERGKALFHQKRGPRGVSLEQCDFGMGPGKLEGAAARLPRYFPDVDRVLDLESRLLHCMVVLQGFNRDDVVKRAISRPATDGSDVEALALYITSRSNGMKVDVPLSHQKERETFKAGEYLFHRRAGQTDFACIQCHGEAGKRIRLQDLWNINDPKHIGEVAGTWPAYRGAHFVVRTMQWRLYDCFWQMRLPELKYASDTSIALASYLQVRGNGAVIQVPGFKR
jgi:sulfur-oxidizing protein SoxA